MAYCWKEEFAVIDEDGDECGWYDELEAAIECAEANGRIRITRMRHYSTEYDDVWSAEDGLMEPDE